MVYNDLMSSPASKQEVTEALQAFGLNTKEIQAYMALLSLGKGSAYAIARAANLKLSTAYVVVESLLNKGIIVRVPQTRKRLYAPRLPYVLLETLQQRASLFEKVLPFLTGVTREPGNAHLLFYEGVEGIRDGLWYRLKEISNQEIVAFYGAAGKVSSEMEELFSEWNETITSKKIKVRAVVPDHPSLKKHRRLDTSYDRAVKIVPYQQYTADMSIDVTSLFVRIIIFGDTPQCLIIESKDVAQTFRQIFEMVWGHLPNKK